MLEWNKLLEKGLEFGHKFGGNDTRNLSHTVNWQRRRKVAEGTNGSSATWNGGGKWSKFLVAVVYEKYAIEEAVDFSLVNSLAGDSF